MGPPLPTTNETCRHARKMDISCRDHVSGTPRCLCPVLVVGFAHSRCHPGCIAFASLGVYTTRPHKANDMVSFQRADGGPESFPE